MTERIEKLAELAETLPKAVRKGASGFYEAVLSVYFFYAFLPDSIGLIDRYLYPYYKKDVESGKITENDAKDFLQELFIMIQSTSHPETPQFTRGGECHFAVGGYTPEGEDGFNELSRLIIEALLDTPVYCPQVSFRRTEKTPFETLKFMMDRERTDKNKRIDFINDEPRIRALIKSGIDFEKAVDYTATGCNETILNGGTYFGGMKSNIVSAITGVMYARSDEAAGCRTFDEFYSLFEDELASVLEKIQAYSDKFNGKKAKDLDVVSSIFLDGCIENAASVTQGGCTASTNALQLIGSTNVIDSLSVIKQFVYDEKIISPAELIGALKNDWQGYEKLRTRILNTGRFFGNNDPLSDGIAKRFFDSVARCLDGKKDLFGFPVFGCRGAQIGYHPHHTLFGDLTEATPDGRQKGEMFTYGMNQINGKDREGLTALLSSLAQADESDISFGPSVTNVLVDEKMMFDDAQFEKTARLFETYFKLGGLHLQLNYVAKEDLIKAKANPAEYGNLRVRVSGFSEYFINLLPELQDEIIARTVVSR